MISILIDEHLMMRSLQLSDAAKHFQAVNSSRSHLRKWLSWVDVTTKEEHTLQYIQKIEQQHHNHETIVLGIFFDSELIGEIGMYEWSHSLKLGKIGYWISHEFEGHGIMYKCFSRFIEFLFEKIGLNKLEIRYVPRNKRSARLPDLMGFKREGVLRQSFLLHGQLEDLIVSGLLRNEWQAMR